MDFIRMLSGTKPELNRPSGPIGDVGLTEFGVDDELIDVECRLFQGSLGVLRKDVHFDGALYLLPRLFLPLHSLFNGIFTSCFNHNSNTFTYSIYE